MQIPALIDGCQSGVYHIALMAPIRHPIRGRTGFSRSCGVCGQSVSSPPLPSHSLHFFALTSIFGWPKTEKCFQRAENPTETLATQAKTLQTWRLKALH